MREDHDPAYKVEVATVEELLRLLEKREQDDPPGRKDNEIVRNGIFVARLLDQRNSSYGFPSVRRYVVASFVYGRDLISFKRTTSSAVELPEMADKLEERQQLAYEQIRMKIENGLKERSLEVPLHEGSLRHLT